MGPIEIARIIFALAAVLGMIGLAAVGAKRAGLAGLQAGRGKRLKLVETLALDQRRRAAIIACDGREHLIILDNGSATVIEQAIPAPAIEETPAPIEPVPPSRSGRMTAPSFIRFFRRHSGVDVSAYRTAGIL